MTSAETLSKPSNADITEDVLQVQESLNHIPTSSEYEREGQYDLATVLYRFGGSWENVLTAAGIDPEEPRGTVITNDAVLDDIARVADELGHTPTFPEYGEHGRYGTSVVSLRFGLYRNALEKLGLDLSNIRETEYRVPTQELLDDFARIANELGHLPTSAEFNERSDHVLSTLLPRFESYQVMVEEAGLDPEEAPGGPNSRARLTAQDLIDDLARVGDELGRPPSVDEYREHGQYSHTMLVSRVGPYREALEKAGLDPDELPSGGQPGRPRTPKHKILDDLARVGSEVYEELGRRPSSTEYNKRGEYTAPTAAKRFDNDLGAAFDAAGVPGTGVGDATNSADEDVDEDDGADEDDEE